MERERQRQTDGRKGLGSLTVRGSPNLHPEKMQEEE